MRYRILGGVAAAALGLAVIGTWGLPASAQVARWQPAFASGADAGDLLTFVRERGGGGSGGGNSGGGRADRSGGGDRFAAADRGGERLLNRDRDRRDVRSRSDTSRVTRVVRDRDGKRRRIIVHRYYNYPFWGGGVAAGYGVASYAGYCMSQFQAYDPDSGLYLGYDGLWYSCP